MVLVTATDGGAGLTATSMVTTETLAAVRRAELRKSAEALGVSRLVSLGYADSGLDGLGTPSTSGLAADPAGVFTAAAVEEVATRVAAILAEEDADVLVGYDAAGGYGHPDHVHVHRVARRAVQLAPRTALLEATLPREPLARAVRLAYGLRRVVPAVRGLDPQSWMRANTARADITHRVDVRGFAEAKREALAAHASQQAADGDARTLHVLLRLPRPIFRLLMGWEWFVGPRHPARHRYSHPLAALQGGARW